ncbi:MAG: Lrp/AsnC family transcriptional regulator, partial [Geminicoccaceae bacterium]
MDAKLDIFDIRLLALLQDDATRSMSELAREVGLSTSPCWRRIKRMQDEGIIKRQVAVLDRKALGLEFVVYTYVKLAVTTSESLANFE